MRNIKLQENLYWQLLQVAISAKHNLMSIAEKYGLTVMQLYTLCLLDSKTSFPMNSLSSKLHCDASNITGIVDRLLQNKYIIREENPTDRREKIIKLTPKGIRICAKISEENNFTDPESLRKLSEVQKKQFSKVLSIIIEFQSSASSSKR